MTRKANSRHETEGSNHGERRDRRECFSMSPLRAMWLKKRRALFDAQDDIDRRREQLIAEIEGKLQQRVSQNKLFSIRWKLA